MKSNRCIDRINRLLAITSRLTRLESLSFRQIAEEYDVSVRTTRRDIEKLKEFFPLENTDGMWRIDLQESQRRHGLLANSLLQAFAENLRIEASCLDAGRSDPRLVDFAVRYHRLPRELGEQLLKMMIDNQNATFDYVDKERNPSHRRIAPVKLLHAQGFWYLIAYDYNRQAQRTFRLDHIRNLSPLPDLPPLDPAIRKRLESIRDPWQQSDAPETIRILLYADPEAAPYLRDVPLHPTQKLEEPHTDGGVIFSYTLSHPMELLPKIKSWIPHLQVLEPESLKKDFLQEIKNYLEEQ